MKTNDNLKNFFSAYFHEDWTEEADDPADIVALYIVQAPSRRQLRELAQAIDLFASRDIADEELERALFEELGCYYRPSADSKGVREWLRDVVQALQTEIQIRRPEQ